MLELERLVLVGIMLGVAAYHDVRTRSIPDYVWIMGAVAGAVLYVFDWHEVDYFILFAILTGAGISFVIWRFFPMGDADALAVLAVSVAYPVSFGVVINPIVMFLGGLILEHAAAFLYNLRYNIQDILQGRMFAGVNCTWATKFAAFYSVHLRRNSEKFTFCAERIRDGKRTIDLSTPSPESDYETRTDVFVMWAMPAMPFMLVALLLGAVAGLLL